MKFYPACGLILAGLCVSGLAQAKTWEKELGCAYRLKEYVYDDMTDSFSLDKNGSSPGSLQKSGYIVYSHDPKHPERDGLYIFRANGVYFVPKRSLTGHVQIVLAQEADPSKTDTFDIRFQSDGKISYVGTPSYSGAMMRPSDPEASKKLDEDLQANPPTKIQPAMVQDNTVASDVLQTNLRGKISKSYENGNSTGRVPQLDPCKGLGMDGSISTPSAPNKESNAVGNGQAPTDAVKAIFE